MKCYPDVLDLLLSSLACEESRIAERDSLTLIAATLAKGTERNHNCRGMVS
jgi:hypothetical protein